MNPECSVSNGEVEQAPKLNEENKHNDGIEEILSEIPQRALPNANVPEKIIICLDVCDDATDVFEIDNKNINASLEKLKKVIDYFCNTKQFINSKTEFALSILKESEVLWVHDFSDDVYNFCEILNSNVHNEPCYKKEFDLSLIFNLIYEKIDFPTVNNDFNLIPPTNIVRLIVMYNRSNCVPKLLDSKIFDLLKNHPYFTLDVLYSHEENCEKFLCEEIYKSFQSLDNGYSYMFEVSKDFKKFSEAGAKLLAHPLQRPLQKYSSYEYSIEQLFK